MMEEKDLLEIRLSGNEVFLCTDAVITLNDDTRVSTGSVTAIEVGNGKLSLVQPDQTLSIPLGRIYRVAFSELCNIPIGSDESCDIPTATVKISPDRLLRECHPVGCPGEVNV